MWLLLTVLVGMLLWWQNKGVKDKAVLISKRYCDESDVQMLDGSVWLRALWFKRDAQGRLRLWRKYVFEFSSTGDQRYRGQLVMLGDEVELIDMEPHRLH